MTEEVHKLGEVLRAAREAKGVDIVRVERETKIRERYLSALERGDYRELPGSVYTKGFLRNYGAYLGLDPDYLIDLYRLETASPVTERLAMPVPPRPLSTRGSRALVLTPGVVVAALLTLFVGGLAAWIGFELVTFARTPELRITEPAGNLSAYPDLSITVRGVTAPNATVTVSNLPENPTVEADASGAFEVAVGLLPGSNVIRITANDPVTRRNSATEERTVVVVTAEASPSPAGALAVAVPAAGAVVPPGPVPVSGTAAPGAEVTVAAALITAPAAAFRITTPSGAPVAVRPTLPAPPAPLALDAAADGSFTGQLTLAAGIWDVSAAVAGADTITRRVTVASAAGLQATLQIVDGESYVVLEQDGAAVENSDRIAADGETIALRADESLRIRVGNGGAVRITINGITIGLMGANGEVVEWRVTRQEG